MEDVNAGHSLIDAVLMKGDLWDVVDQKVAGRAMTMQHIARVLGTVTMVLHRSDADPAHIIMVADSLVSVLRSTVDDECRELDGLCTMFELVNHPDIGPLN